MMTTAGSVTVRTFVVLVVSSVLFVVRQWMIMSGAAPSSSSSSGVGVVSVAWEEEESRGHPLRHQEGRRDPSNGGGRSAGRTEEAAVAGGAAGGPRLPPAPVGSTTPNLGTTIVVLCHMSGEMGNHLDLYAHCHALRRILEDRYDLSHNNNSTSEYIGGNNNNRNNHHRYGVRVVARHGYRDEALRDLPLCFPHFRSVDFDEGAQDAYDQALVGQQQVLQRLSGDSSEATIEKEEEEEVAELGDYQLVHNAFTTMSTRYEPSTVLAELDAFVDRLRASSTAAGVEGATTKLSTTGTPIDLNPMSVLYARWLFSVDAFVDLYADELREMYEFLDNSTECCQLVPDPDETVFHLRNFVVEMPHQGKELGFQELSPRQAARDLFGHLAKGDRVAVVSRFSVEHAQPYLDALTAMGLNVRLVEGQSGLQDFCFLRRAQKEVVGMAISTYFMWAALLGDCPSVTAYSVDTPERRQMFGDGHLTYNFSHPLLRGRFAFPLIAPDDEIEGDEHEGGGGEDG